MSRKLPPTERVTHTLLALNYGAILSLLVPVLVRWTEQPTTLVTVWYGIGSVLAPLASLGVILFALRDVGGGTPRAVARAPRRHAVVGRAARPPACTRHRGYRLHRRQTGRRARRRGP